MASSLLTLLDDIASTLDDIAAMTKIATKKTAGVLGDDLALNAQQVTGVTADRELPIVWAVAKGSAVNKLILVPVAILISQFIPWLITPLLMAGGLFLCYEGFEKVYEKLFHKKVNSEVPASPQSALQPYSESYEKDRIKGAVRTDFILSAEIIVISLGTVANADLIRQLGVLTGISVIMTIGVYGLVAVIVKLDDWGLILAQPGKSQLIQKFGQGITAFAPMLMKFLGVAGTIAMFLVGGGILVHGIGPLHHLEETYGALAGMGLALATGMFSGGFVVGAVEIFKKLKHRK